MKIKLTAKNFKFVKPSPEDSRDIIYSTVYSAPIEEASLEEFRGPILNQGSYGACTGFGTAGLLRSFFKRLTTQAVDFNPWFIYYNARKRSGWENEDKGAYPREIFQSLILDGCIEASSWEPGDKILDDPPTFEDKDLIRFKGYKRFELGNIDDIHKTFSNYIGTEKLPIGIGMSIFQKATAIADKTGVFRFQRNDTNIGGHWIFADAVTKEGLVIVNSWGKEWGNNGTAIIPWDTFKNFVFEAWSLNPELP
jgi:hypothetical protein